MAAAVQIELGFCPFGDFGCFACKGLVGRRSQLCRDIARCIHRAPAGERCPFDPKWIVVRWILLKERRDDPARLCMYIRLKIRMRFVLPKPSYGTQCFDLL